MLQSRLFQHSKRPQHAQRYQRFGGPSRRAPAHVDADASFSNALPSICPFCKQQLTSKRARKHLASCAPDLLEPQRFARVGLPMLLQSLDSKGYGASHPARRCILARFVHLPAAGIDASSVASAANVSERLAVRFVRQEITDLGYVSDDHAAQQLRIIANENDLLVVDKPAEMQCSPSSRFAGGSVLSGAKALLGYEALLAHRLDASTSGVLVLCKHKQYAQHVQRELQPGGSSQKVYIARCNCSASGTSEASMRITYRIAKACPSRNSARVTCHSPSSHYGTEACTDVRVLRRDDRRCEVIVALKPHTGRTHQLRAHLSSVGLPIIGDTLYGGAEAGRVMLHAQSLSFHDMSGPKRVFKASEPAFLADT